MVRVGFWGEWGEVKSALPDWGDQAKMEAERSSQYRCGYCGTVFDADHPAQDGRLERVERLLGTDRRITTAAKLLDEQARACVS